MWSNEQVLKFIEDYHASECLWNVKSLDYRNRMKKKMAMKALAQKHNMEVVDVEKKIHNLKTSFNRERKKYSSRSRGSLKKSIWFAYEYMQFLLPANESKGSRTTDLVDTQSGNNTEKDIWLYTNDNQKEEAFTRDDHSNPNVDMGVEDDHPLFKTPIPSKRFQQSIESPAQQTVNCMKSLTEIVTARDEYSVFGEYVANKIRNCKRPRMEVSLAQRDINNVLFRLDMGLLASELPSNQTPHKSHTSSQEIYRSNPSTSTEGELEGFLNVQLQEQFESRNNSEEIQKPIKITDVRASQSSNFNCVQ